MQTKGQLYNAADYSKLIVAYRNGSPVRLSDLGRVIDSIQNDKNLNFYYDADSPQGTAAIQMVVFKQPGTNAVQVVDGIKAMLPRLQAAAAAIRRTCTYFSTARSRFAIRWTT